MRHSPQRTLLSLAAALLLALPACGDDDPPARPDAGTDTGTDVETDAPEDTGDDTPDDDVTPDTGPDIGDDTDADTGDDADTGLPDGLSIPGLSTETTVHFDAFGVLHASCATDEDCAAVLGYFHARDRFLQMDIRRRLTTGRLTQATGPLGIDIAESYRTIFTTPSGEPLEEVLAAGMPAETRLVFEAYANGVNAWLDDLEAGRNGARLPDETRFPLVSFDNIPRWTVEDSFATILALVESLTNDSGAILRRGTLFAAMDEETWLDLYNERTPIDAPTLLDYVGEGAGAKVNLPLALPRHAPLLRRAAGAMNEAAARLEAAGMMRDELRGSTGSNIWTVAPERSASGNALFSNDPHLQLSNPAIWYIAHLDAKTEGTGEIHAAGVTFAGLPFVILGQNEHIAWGATTTYFDLTDVYIETLSDDGTGVVFNGETVPFVTRDWVYEFPDGTSETRTARYVPHHGPVLSIDEEAGTAVSMRWTGNSIFTDGWFLADLMRATSVDEARTALRGVTTVGQNWMVADRSGQIGWFPYNTVPLRPWASLELPSALPLPGDGSAEWDGFYDYDDLPQAFNPARGFIANANNDMTGALYDGDPYNDGYSVLQVAAAPGYRQARMLEVLEGSTEHTRDDMLALVGDTTSLLGRLVTPFLLDAAAAFVADDGELDPNQQRMIDALTDWDYTCPTGLTGPRPTDDADPNPAVAAASIGCTALHRVLGTFWRLAFEDDVQRLDLPNYPRLDTAVQLLIRPDVFLAGVDTYWDDSRTEDRVETRDDILLAALRVAGADLTERLGEDIDGWRWGRVHTLTLRADLFDNLGVATYNHGPFATPGGTGTVNVAAPNGLLSGNFGHASGASMRFVCELFPEGPACTIQLPGGQRHFRDSPFYDDRLFDWITNTPIDVNLDIDDVASDAGTETLIVLPRD